MAKNPTTLSLAPRSPALADPTVLLVDDDPALLQLLEHWLTGNGLRILTANNGLEALDALRKEKAVALVVSDYDMPGMNGIALLDEVSRSWPEARRILFTGYADSEVVISARRHRVLTKQMDSTLLKRAILREALR